MPQSNPYGVFTSDVSFTQHKIDGEPHTPSVQRGLCNGSTWPPGAYCSVLCVYEAEERRELQPHIGRESNDRRP